MPVRLCSRIYPFSESKDLEYASELLQMIKDMIDTIHFLDFTQHFSICCHCIIINVAVAVPEPNKTQSLAPVSFFSHAPSLRELAFHPRGKVAFLKRLAVPVAVTSCCCGHFIPTLPQDSFSFWLHNTYLR